MSDLVGNPEDRFSQNEAHIMVVAYRKKEVVQLERKAQEANTVDERLNVELQAVEMQISMVRLTAS